MAKRAAKSDRHKPLGPFGPYVVLRPGGDPVKVAQMVRDIFTSKRVKMIATTWDEYLSDSPKVTAYQAAIMVQEQCGCTFEQATDALETAIPELFAGYWEALPWPETLAQTLARAA